MKHPTISLLALILLTSPSLSGDFSGAFGRTHLPACNSVIGNFVGAFDTCPMLGNGPNPSEVSASAPSIPEPPPPHECPPKGDETPA